MNDMSTSDGLGAEALPATPANIRRLWPEHGDKLFGVNLDAEGFEEFSVNPGDYDDFVGYVDDAPFFGEGAVLAVRTPGFRLLMTDEGDQRRGSLDELRESCGYKPDGEEESEDALLDYKDALEDRLSTFEADLARTEAALTQVQHVAYEGVLKFDEPLPNLAAVIVYMSNLQNRIEKIQGIAEGQAADPEFVAMLAADNR